MTETIPPKVKNAAAVLMGHLGGSKKSPRKAAACRKNGKRRPVYPVRCKRYRCHIFKNGRCPCGYLKPEKGAPR